MSKKSKGNFLKGLLSEAYICPAVPKLSIQELSLPHYLLGINVTPFAVHSEN
jgi:hypothetical protein